MSGGSQMWSSTLMRISSFGSIAPPPRGDISCNIQTMATTGPLAGVRVLDRTTGIAGPYCTKLLVDAGAEVVKVEPVDDPMRSWRDGLLFEYLNAGKRSVADDAHLVDGA